jgi:hypothetical protein
VAEELDNRGNIGEQKDDDTSSAHSRAGGLGSLQRET